MVCGLGSVFGPGQLHVWDARSTCGLVAMTSASHAEGRQFDPGQVFCEDVQQGHLILLIRWWWQQGHPILLIRLLWAEGSSGRGAFC